jgi:1-acyl-sn-glycerol-3-phosphate acyltransferase
VPLLVLPSKYTYLNGKAWALVIEYALNIICGIKFTVKGKENLPTTAYIIASKHQSALETILFWRIFAYPAYILKKELFNIPIFGTFLQKMRMIGIDRKAGASALKQVIKGAKEAIKHGRTIIIYPEGTRAAIGERKPYKPGIAALYSQKIAPVIPVAVNSGLFWQKDSFIKKPGTFIVEFLPAIDQGLTKDEFMQVLQEKIETATESLIKNS